MAAPSSSAVGFFSIREDDESILKQQQLLQQQPGPAAAAAGSSQPKKRRNQPGTPYPDAEVIALSPKTLMATNRFICEVCSKGFQREQNLQLHRRGHNLPWKLKQKTNKEVKRKVYLCPEPTCVHHEASRALGDLTGIKKHYSRKHGEKKYKCEKCSKKYAVQSDWKAHSKTCGTREYRCDCGTLFSRRDSFITHRAFCDALAQETARHPSTLSSIGSHLFGNSNMSLGLSPAAALGVGLGGHQIPDHQQPSTDVLRLGGSSSGHLLTSPFRATSQPSPAAFFLPTDHQQDFRDQQQQNKPFQGLMQPSDLQNNPNPNPFGINENSSNSNILSSPPSFLHPSLFSGNNNNGASAGSSGEGSNLFSGNMIANQIASLYSGPNPNLQNNNAGTAHMSATALLLKAAQMGSTTSNTNSGASLLMRSFGSSSSAGENKLMNNTAPMPVSTNFGGMFGDNMNGNNNFNELMNSLGGGGSNIFGGGSGSNIMNTNAFGSGNEVEENSFAFGSDRLTRDFLGVGQIVRSMSGIDHHHQMTISLDSDGKEKAAQKKSQAFGDRNYH